MGLASPSPLSISIWTPYNACEITLLLAPCMTRGIISVKGRPAVNNSEILRQQRDSSFNNLTLPNWGKRSISVSSFILPSSVLRYTRTSPTTMNKPKMICRACSRRLVVGFRGRDPPWKLLLLLQQVSLFSPVFPARARLIVSHVCFFEVERVSELVSKCGIDCGACPWGSSLLDLELESSPFSWCGWSSWNLSLQENSIANSSRDFPLHPLTRFNLTMD